MRVDCFGVVVDFAGYRPHSNADSAVRVSLNCLKGGGRRSEVQPYGLRKKCRDVYRRRSGGWASPQTSESKALPPASIRCPPLAPTYATETNCWLPQSQARIGRPLGVFCRPMSSEQTRPKHAALDDFDIAANGKKRLARPPRSSTLASVPVDSKGIGAIRDGLRFVSNGPLAPRAMPGASWIILTESRDTPLVISEVAPRAGNQRVVRGAR